MMAIFSRSVRLIGVACAIAVGLALASGRAAAECGDHVRIVPKVPHAGDHEPMPKPCDGPSCSRNPSAPVPPASAPVQGVSLVKSATIEPPTLTIDSESGWRIDGLSAGRPIDRASLVFHPPRG